MIHEILIGTLGAVIAASLFATMLLSAYFFGSLIGAVIGLAF